jgi:ATP adenylyltransferase
MTSQLANLNNECRFCAMGALPNQVSWDELLMEEGLVRVVPSKGSIVWPWLLLIPDSHVPSAALLSFSEKESVARLVEDIRQKALIDGKHLIIFENGSPTFGSRISCGIDHTHIHMVLLDFDLIEILQKELPVLALSPSPWSIYSDVQPKPYIYVSDGDRSVYFDASNIPSQFVRSIIAKLVGRTNEFDYDMFPEEGNVLKTISWFKRISSNSRLLVREAVI